MYVLWVFAIWYLWPQQAYPYRAMGYFRSYSRYEARVFILKRRNWFGFKNKSLFVGVFKVLLNGTAALLYSCSRKSRPWRVNLDGWRSINARNTANTYKDPRSSWFKWYSRQSDTSCDKISSQSCLTKLANRTRITVEQRTIFRQRNHISPHFTIMVFSILKQILLFLWSCW